MLRLVYVSTAIPDLDREELNRLVTTFCEKNDRLRITGALAYSAGKFCQCLEGRDDDIFNLMETIVQDWRHNKVKVIAEMPISRRAFENWGMVLVNELDFEILIEKWAKSSENDDADIQHFSPRRIH